MQKKSRRYSWLCILLSILLISTFLPIPEIAHAEVETNTNTNANGFIENIVIAQAFNSLEQIPNYNFDPQVSHYEIEIPAVYANMKPTIAITLNKDAGKNLTEEPLHYSLYTKEKDGTYAIVNRMHDQKAIKQVETKVPLGLWFASQLASGEQKDFVIRVGKLGKDKKYTDYDEYVYTITKKTSLAIKDGIKDGIAVSAKGNNVELTPNGSLQDHPYDNTFTGVVGDAQEIELTLNVAKTGGDKNASSTISVNGKSYSAEKKFFSLSELMDAETGVASFDIVVETGSSKNQYTLYLCKEDLTPAIESQPTDLTVEKNDHKPLSVIVKNSPQNGEITYQWYSKKINGLIAGANQPDFYPPTEYAGTETYYCIVKNKVGVYEFEKKSNEVEYTVNLTYPTAPDIKTPYLYGNGDSPFFVQNQSPTVDVLIKKGNINEYVEGLPYRVELYRSIENSTENGVFQCEGRATSNTQGMQDGNFRIYEFTLPQQDVLGNYYYYVKVTVENNGQPNSKVSSPLKLTFKAATDVVTKLEGTGSNEDPFRIYEQKDLEYIKSMVEGTADSPYAPYDFAGQTLRFENDITLNTEWKPIGALKEGGKEDDRGISLLPFSGILDGNNKTVTVADYGKPLFNYVRKSTVKNLKIQGAHIQGYGLVDKYVVDYGENATYVNDPVKLRTIDIENVTIVSGTKILKAGFIGGYASGANAVNIRNCTVEKGVIIGDDGTWGDLGDTSFFYPYISAPAVNGGLFDHRDMIGSFGGAFNGTITNSVSYATVYGRTFVGGLIGMKGQSMGPCTILNSAFLGEVVASGNRAGGISGAGYIAGSAPGTPTIQVCNCYVNAKISGADEVGGIVGSESGHVEFNDTGDEYGVKGAVSITDNFFYGELKATSGANVGGILGYVNDFTKKSGEATNFYLKDCGAKDGIGGSVSGKMVGTEKYAAEATLREFLDGTILTKLNASKTSYQNWELKENANFPTISKTPVVTSLSIEGDYKTEYVLGEELDLTGIRIYANWSDKKRTELAIGTDVIYSGYDKNIRGQQTITFQYKAIRATIGITVLKQDNVENPKTISVLFSLLGDRIHDSDTDGKIHTLETGGLTSWYSNESYSVGINDTVWDLLQKVEAKHSKEIKFHNQGNYIDYLYYDSTGNSKFDTTTAIGEFTNGKLSGWMYTLNGTHPALGIEEQYLENGDRIIWHYTDDYMKEPDTKDWIIPDKVEKTDEVKAVTTSGAAGSASTTAPTEVKVTEKKNADGTKETVAESKVSTDNQKEILKQAAEKKSAEIILEVSKADSKGADSVQLSLDVTFVKNVADKTNADLTVNTENGKVTLDQETIKTVLAEAKGATITLEVSKVSKPTEVQKKAAGANGHLLKLTIKSGDKVISDFNKGKVKVVAEIVSKLLDKKVAAIHIADDGKIEQLAGKVLTIGGKKYYEFTTPHFSTFALVDADELGLEVAEEPTVDAKALTAKLTPVARSAKTAKKNVKVTVRLDKQDKAIVQELKDAGYTVKYRFYRSTKKTAGYKAAVTKKTTSYTNTSGKKGTKYFYKVQVRVYDENGKLTAKTALKQCKYASRAWSR